VPPQIPRRFARPAASKTSPRASTRALRGLVLAVPTVLVAGFALMTLSSEQWTASPSPTPGLEDVTLAVSSVEHPGDVLEIVGSGFPKHVLVTFLWNGEPVEWLPDTRTDSTGALSMEVTVPWLLDPGSYQLTVRPAEGGIATEEVETVTVGVPTVVSTNVAEDDLTEPPHLLPTATAEPTPAPTRGAPTPSAAPDPTDGGGTAAAPSQGAPAPVAPPATVGVAGYGAASKGGAGGKVLSVTNLNDSGPGSLRAAIDASGPRVVVFGVAGTINLAGDLRVDDPFLTLDGSTAPGPVVVRGGMLLVTTHDVIVRHLRFRPGDQVGSPADVDAVTLNGLRGEVYNVVLDHVSMVWGPDIGGLSLLGNVHDVTVQYSIMGEGLYLSRHPEAVASQDGHSMGASIFQLDPGVAWPKRLTLHHNLFTTSDNRMPVIQGAECVDVVNNVIYNWGIKSLSGNPRGLNAVNNWFRPGPETTSLYVYQWQKHSANPDPYANSVYLSGNVADGFGYAVEAPGGVVRSGPACGGLSVGVRSAQAGFDTVVATAGATLPARDAVDGRIIANVINRSGTFFNGAGHSSPNPYYP
jgi:pectate lyase